ncbi:MULTISPECIES: hypothetical protein [unclassified Janthinobacterium]|uniref:hypothetical protein n=1 Tax=unclassified Janthinobacterium TaxID=2610881 RepID=UPI0018CA779A|nr:hypothetical protein [Janthinobacterium sp. CG_23.4]MDH6159672.1 hypothetical protein [Janthinobacterium sp. CG_23.4]
MSSVPPLATCSSSAWPTKRKARARASTAIKVVQLEGIKTTDKDVDSSVKQVKVKDTVRPLTKGEIDMAWMLFQDAIDYGKLKVHGEPPLWLSRKILRKNYGCWRPASHS